MTLRTPRAWAPEQLRLEGHEVPVAGRAVDQALEVQVVLDAESHGQRAHAHPRHGRVGDVDDVDARLLERAWRRSIVRSMRMLRGGSISTETTKRPASREPRQAGRRRRTVGPPVRVRRRARSSRRRAAAVDRAAPRRRLAGAAPSSTARIAAMCSGVVPQQPPTSRAPAAMKRGVTRAEVGRAGGIDEAALEPLRQAGVGHDRAGGSAVQGDRPSPRGPPGAAGPAPQLTPTASAPAAAQGPGARAGGSRRGGRGPRRT